MSKRLLFLALGHLSRGDVTIAADFALQLPPGRFEVCFVCTADVVGYLAGLGLPARALAGGSPARNVADLDAYIAEFRPDLLIAADAFTLNYSTSWSGVSMALLRERFPDIRLASFDQYDWAAARYVLDFYADNRTLFPKLLDSCDLTIRNCPLNRPATAGPATLVSPMRCAPPPGCHDGVIPAAPSRTHPVVFLANSRWEYLNVLGTSSMQQLINAMPRLLHAYLAGLRRPLEICHVGPVPWRFPIADQLRYHYVAQLPPEVFYQRLLGADVFLTANAVSVTLTQAVLAGVPALVLQSHHTAELSDGPHAAWFAAAAPRLKVAYPFRVFPWGWHDFLQPVLSDNPYTDCFLQADIFEPDSVYAALHVLLDEPQVRGRLRERQRLLADELGRLTPPADAFEQVVMS